MPFRFPPKSLTQHRRFLSLFAAQLENPAFAWTVTILWVMAIVGTVAWFRLGGIGLVDETEPLFAEAARQMTLTGDWVTPYFNEATRFDKPPLVYWLMAITYQTVGVNEWSARFPSALAITVLTAISFYTLYRFGIPRPSQVTPQSLPVEPEAKQTNTRSDTESNTRSNTTRSIALEQQTSSHAQLVRWLSALIGSAAIALNPQTFLWSRTGVSDMLLSGCMGVALLCFFCGYGQPESPQVQRRWYLAFFVFSALAVLTKGPVGVVLPGLIVAAFLVYIGKLRSVLRELPWGWGAGLFLVITLPWYILVIARNGQTYIDAFFGYHNLERFTSVVNNHSAPWYFYIPVVALSFLPWSVHLLIAIIRLRFWQRTQWQQQPRSTHLGLFALTWFVVIFGFFTIAVTKLPSYTLPLLPAAGIVVGLFWSDQMTRSQPRLADHISHGITIILYAGLAFAALYSPHWLGNDPEMPDLPALLEQTGIPLWGMGIWATATLIGLLLWVNRQGRWLWSVNLIGLMAFMLMGLIPAAVVVDSQRQLPLRELATTIEQVQQPEEPIVMVGFGKPSLVFYTQRPVTYLPDPDRAIRDLRLLTRDRNAESLLLLGRSVKIAETELPPDAYQLLDQKGVYQLVRIPTAALRAGRRK